MNNRDLISRKEAIKHIKEMYAEYDRMYRGDSKNLFDELSKTDNPTDKMIMGGQFGLEQAWEIIESLPPLSIKKTSLGIRRK